MTVDRALSYDEAVLAGEIDDPPTLARLRPRAVRADRHQETNGREPMGSVSEVDRSVVVNLADVDPEFVDWLWKWRLPIGKIVILDGDPSVGKSTVTTDLAARVTTGSPMPDGERIDGPADVVLMTAEDGASDTVRPRFDAGGGDPSRVHLFEAVTEVDVDGIVRNRPPCLPADVHRLETIVTRTKAKLVVVDVLAAYLGSTDSHKDTDVRRVLHPLAAMAERTRCVVVCLRHLSKNGGSNPIYRGGGSIAFIGAARVGLLAAVDPEDDTRRILAVSKSNLGPMPSALAYRLVDAPEHGCARVAWEGATEHRAADLLVVHDDGDGEDAAGVLRELLADGPLWVKDVLDAMAAAGFSKDQSKRAKSRAGVRSVKVGKPGDPESGWQWELRKPRQTSEGSEGGGVHTPHPSPPSLLTSGDDL